MIIHLYSLDGLLKNRIACSGISVLEELLHLSKVTAGGEVSCDRADDVSHAPVAAKQRGDVGPVRAQMFPGKWTSLKEKGSARQLNLKVERT